MELQILGVATDLRTGTPVLYAQVPIADYFSLIGPEFDEFSIQRKREKHPAYARMKSDIRGGVLLPTITLAASLESAENLKKIALEGSIPKIREKLLESGNLKILDGLQRTYVLKDIIDEGHIFPPNQTLHLEIRIEPDLKHLIYRIIVLNAGQKPMSMRHQIEILFLSFKETLERSIPHLELFKEVEAARRTRSRKFALDRIASGYQAFILKSPEIEKQNVVAQKFSEESVLETSEEELGLQFAEFSIYLKKYCELDDEVCRVYDDAQNGLPTGAFWLGNENTINAFFAAVADFGTSDDRKKRIEKAIDALIAKLTHSQPGDDPLGLRKYQEIVQAFPVRKTNVGFATRKLTFVSFKEFFRDEGEGDLATVWEKEAE